jgi:hypothetical protein
MPPFMNSLAAGQPTKIRKRNSLGDRSRGSKESRMGMMLFEREQNGHDALEALGHY